MGKLSNDSSNVVQLVVNQYEAITSVLEMKDNATGSVKVTYFSSCSDPTGPLRQTNKCSGLKVGSKVTFTAKIEVLKCPKDPREWRQQFQISPVGINEAVLVDLEMICNCECEVAGNPGYEENSESCGGVGSYKCGVCECPEDYFGRRCECSATNLSFQGEWEAGCRSDNTTQVILLAFHWPDIGFNCFSLVRLCATTAVTASAASASVCPGITRRRWSVASSASATTSAATGTRASCAAGPSTGSASAANASATASGTCRDTQHVSRIAKD